MAYPDYDLIARLRQRFSGDGFRTLTEGEAMDLINNLAEALNDAQREIETLKTKPAPKENVWSREYSLESVSDFYADDDFEEALTAVLGFEPDITRRVKITIEEVL